MLLLLLVVTADKRYQTFAIQEKEGKFTDPLFYSAKIKIYCEVLAILLFFVFYILYKG